MLFRGFARLAPCLSLALVAVSGHAAPPAEPGIDELEALLATPVYAASKFAQKVAEAPATVTVLTAGDIRTFGWRTLAEVLNAVRGVHLRNDQAYDYVGVRGLSRPGDYSSRVLLLIDGVRTNENMYDSALVGREFPLDVGLIERVEFIAGPGSALYGSNAVFGVVNVVTRSAANLRGNQVTVTTAGRAGRKVQATSGRELGAGSLLLAASAERRAGIDRYYPEYDTPATHDGVATGLDAEDDRKVYARYVQREWTVSAMASQRTKEIPNAAYDAVFNDPDARWRDSFLSTDLTWQREVDVHNQATVHLGVAGYEYKEVGRYVSDGLLNRYLDQGRWFAGEARWATRAFAGHHLVWGGEFQRNFRQRTAVQRIEPTTVPTLEVNTGSNRYGLFANDEIVLTPQVTLGLGARVDKSSSRDARVTPRASLLWAPRSDLVLKALTGSAFRDPNVFETRDGIEGNMSDPTLTRERLRTHELAADWRVADQARLSASLYHTRIRGLIEQVTDGATGLLVYRNTANASADGAEIEGDFVGDSGWRVRTSLARQRVRLSDGRPASNAPASLFKWHGSVPLGASAARLGLEVLGMGSRTTLAGQRLPGRTISNATVQYDPTGQPWSIVFSVYNLGDVPSPEPGGPEHRPDVLQREGRSAALGVTVRF